MYAVYIYCMFLFFSFNVLAAGLHLSVLYFCVLKIQLLVEVWEDDGYKDDIIDNFTIPISNPLRVFDQSNPLTLQGVYGLVNLTVIYGNLTMEPTSCSSSPQPTFTTTLYASQGVFKKIACYLILKCSFNLIVLCCRYL